MVTCAFIIMVAMYGVYFVFGVFFKPVLTEFGWTRTITSGAASLSTIIYGLLGIVMGGLTDRFGPRMVITFCGCLLGLGYLLMSQTSTIWQLYLFYGVIIGMGMSGGFTPLMATVSRWFDERRGMMTGIVQAGLGAGTLIGAPVANLLISTYDWRKAYIILGSTVLVVVVLAAQFLRRDPSRVGQVPYVRNRQEDPGLTLHTDVFPLKEAIRTRQFLLVFAMLLCFGFCLFAILVHIAPHATELGISATTAANILATLGGLSIVGRIVLGSAGDRIGHRQIFIMGFILMSAALFWLVPATEAWMLYLFAAVFGLAYGGCAASMPPLISRLFGLSAHGSILGVADLGFMIGGTISPLLAGYIFDITGSYQLAFLLCAAIGVVGLILVLLLKTNSKGKREISLG
ncbi:MFS transporter [Chloroflexota bacterium]